VPRELWDRAHAILRESPRARANRNRNQTPALLKGLSSAWTAGRCRRRTAGRAGRLYRYYVAQRVLKGDAAADDGIVRRVSAAEIEAAVVDQVRALLRQPEVVVGTWLAARAEAPDLTEARRGSLERLDPFGRSCSRPSRRASCGCWWTRWRSGPPAPTSGSGWRAGEPRP
jgi:hypothetical protein